MLAFNRPPVFSKANFSTGSGGGGLGARTEKDLSTLAGVTAHIRTAPGFFLALDESGGSAPNTIKSYGIPEADYIVDGKADLDKVFELAHQLRVRMVSAPAFSSSQVVGVILFEDSVCRTVDGKTFAKFLLDRGIPPILKIDEGLADLKDGVKLMKPILHRDEKLALAQDNGIFLTKMRSVIYEPNAAGIKAIVAQQFAVGRGLCESGILPILEPERDIKCANPAEADRILVSEIKKQLDSFPNAYNVVLKLSIPAEPDAYAELIRHPRVARVVALSGGHTIDAACDRLLCNPGMSASFSRAARDGLTRDMSDEQFNRAIAGNFAKIFQASIS